MKKYIALILALITLLCLCACGGKDAASADPGFEAVAAAVNGAADSEIMMDVPDTYLQSTMKIDPEAYSDCCVKKSKVGTNINEYGVFRTDDAEALQETLEAYVQALRDRWMDEYLPEEYPKLENAQVWVVGDYVMYEILDAEAADAAEIAFKGCFEG